MDYKRYDGEWTNWDDLTGSGWALPETFPDDADIFYAAYNQDNYEGWANILFKKDGKLYEAHGAHCSCSGLEGMYGDHEQWAPEQTSTEALTIRPSGGYMGFPAEAIDAAKAEGF